MKIYSLIRWMLVHLIGEWGTKSPSEAQGRHGGVARGSVVGGVSQRSTDCKRLWCCNRIRVKSITLLTLSALLLVIRRPSLELTSTIICLKAAVFSVSTSNRDADIDPCVMAVAAESMRGSVEREWRWSPLLPSLARFRKLQKQMMTIKLSMSNAEPVDTITINMFVNVHPVRNPPKLVTLVLVPLSLVTKLLLLVLRLVLSVLDLAVLFNCWVAMAT